jgi:hypothetical protein
MSVFSVRGTRALGELIIQMDAEPERRCGTCRHFEQSGNWKRGWCRSTLLFSPGQSHIVQNEELNCRRGSIDFWEPVRDLPLEPTENAGQKNVKLPTLSSPLKLFEPAPAGPVLGMAGASGGHMMFASSGNGGRGGYDDDDYTYEDDFVDEPPMDEPEPEEPRRRPRSTRTVRASAAGGSGGPTGGQPRVAQHQPEERYWTDYLRIALPVVGLLLMIGLLWYWATQLIGDTPETTEPEEETIGLVNEGTPEPTQQPAEVQDDQNTGTQGNTIGIGNGAANTPEAPAVVTTEPANDPAAGDNQAGTDPEEGAEEPADDPAAEEDTGAVFQSQEVVIVTEDGLNVRPDASTAGDPIAVVNSGDQLTIASGPVEAEGYVWWEVILPDATSGWIVQDYIEAAE